MPVPILKQGGCLIATVPATISDSDWRELEDGLLTRVGRFRSRGVIVDVTELDVLDSFATRTLRAIADAARLRGAETVLVGIQPDVAYAMVQLGLTARFQGVSTALDLEEGLAYLNGRDRRGHEDDGRGR
jgi:rsbT antagonist protein RsbS